MSRRGGEMAAAQIKNRKQRTIPIIMHNMKNFDNRGLIITCNLSHVPRTMLNKIVMKNDILRNMNSNLSHSPRITLNKKINERSVVVCHLIHGPELYENENHLAIDPKHPKLRIETGISSRLLTNETSPENDFKITS